MIEQTVNYDEFKYDHNNITIQTIYEEIKYDLNNEISFLVKCAKDNTGKHI